MEKPRDILRAAGRFVEMDEADVCGGGAGSFHVDYPAISAQILEKKRMNIEKTGASVVVTGCPGCLIQLTKAAKAKRDCNYVTLLNNGIKDAVAKLGDLPKQGPAGKALDNPKERLTLHPPTAPGSNPIRLKTYHRKTFRFFPEQTG